MRLQSLIDELSTIVGPRWVKHRPAELAPFRADGLATHEVTPGLAVLPGNRDEVIAVVRLLNSAGVPLLEIVCHPDISSADMAYTYLNALKDMLMFGGISDCDMEKGMVRVVIYVAGCLVMRKVIQRTSAERLAKAGLSEPLEVGMAVCLWPIAVIMLLAMKIFMGVGRRTLP